jgi:hypothetical protein
MFTARRPFMDCLGKFLTPNQLLKIPPTIDARSPKTVAMNQYVYVSLSLIGLCGLVGAGVAVGSG